MSENPEPHRRLTTCHRHPDHLPTATGLCAPCLHERLSLLSPSTSTENPPELRRCKSFSAKNSGDAVYQPRRRSCEVDSLSSLFAVDGGADTEVESKNLWLTCTVPEEEEDDDDGSVPESKVEEVRVSNLGNNDEDEFDFEQGKTMKEFIDLESKGNRKPNSNNNRKDFKEIAGNLASVFSKKFRKWRKKQECSATDSDCNRNRNGDGDGDGDCSGNRVDVRLGELRLEDLRGRRLSYTQSEVGDYGLGRRLCEADFKNEVVLGRASIDCGAFGVGRKSCDSDPRFSIDIDRESIDESRSEFVDAHRASWDGYLVGGGGKTLPHRGGTRVVSVIENAMATVYGFDDRVLGEVEGNVENGDGNDSSRRRRKGFDRCSSVKKDNLVRLEGGEVGLSNARASTGAIGVFDGTKLLITQKELNEWRLNCSKYDSSESFETASKDLGSVSSSSVGKDEKKCRQWSKLWSFLGLLPRKKGDKFCTKDATNPDEKAAHCNKGTLLRSYSTSSSRASSSVFGSGGGTSITMDSKAIVKRRQDDSVLERNRSVGYSPKDIENGLLRFYLTPLRSRRRNRLGKSQLKKSHSLARSVLKLY